MLTRERARQQVRQAAPPLSAEEKGEILSLINTDYQGTLQLFEGLLPEEVAETVRAFLIRQRAAPGSTAPEVYQVNGAALLGEGCGGLLSGKLLLEDGSNQQVAGMFVVDSGCRGVELDLVLSKTKAESLGLRPYAGPGGQPVVLPGRAANRTPMPVVKMWPQVTMLVPLFRRGTGPVAALRKSNLTAWAADLDIVDYRRGGASEGGGATVNAIGDGEELWDEVASSSSSSVDETILTSHAEYDGTGYQALHSPITEDRHVALLGLSGLAKLGLMADFARNVVFSVRLQGVIASMHSI